MTGLPKFHVTALASALTALLAGCSLAPTYERPAMANRGPLARRATRRRCPQGPMVAALQ